MSCWSTQHFLDYITEMQSKEEYPITDLLHVYMAFSVQRLPQCMYTLSVFLLNQKSAANLFSFVRKALLFWRKSNINYAYLVSLTEIKVMEKIYSLIPLNRAT